MPTPPLPFQCGIPGCHRKFEKPEHLRQHTKDFHSPSKPLPKQQTFTCSVVGCKAESFPQLSLLQQHTKVSHSSPKLPPRDAFKCGVKGCNAASFSELSLLHRHTAVAHPKSSKNTPSGSSTLLSSKQGHPNPPANTQSAQAPALITEPPSCTTSEAQYVSPYHQSAQNAGSSIDYAPATVGCLLKI
ncbi:hypothetical protein C8J57DRAFT_277938 [Mycena rebaudengoi]|nr:hypothetical protein C8J57DRAFT_277938 [Mycena rebaudengoi]